jgi:phosphoglycolate phosphatase-like HAD superfamily hydrolase
MPETEATKMHEEFARGVQARGFGFKPGNGTTVHLNAGFCAEELQAFLKNMGARPGASAHHVSLDCASREQFVELLSRLDDFNNSYAISFDLDGTLVATDASYDKVVADLVERYTGTPLPAEELMNLRLEGGFNDDWDALAELCTRRGTPKTHAEVEPDAVQYYLSIAKKTEFLLIELEILKKLARKHRLFIITGRPRNEYEGIWGHVFDPICAQVYCAGDLPELRTKPHSDYLDAMSREHNLRHAVYIGNSVDDMAAAVAAGMKAVGVTTTLSSAALQGAGAHLILDSVNDIERLFLP